MQLQDRAPSSQLSLQLDYRPKAQVEKLELPLLNIY